MHIERLTKNFTFWSNCVSKAERFFRVCALLELLSKWYTRSTVQNTTVCADGGLARVKVPTRMVDTVIVTDQMREQ